MQKIKTVSVKDSRIVVETAITTVRRDVVLTGEPRISLHDKFIQVGCIRFSYEVLGILADLGKRRLMYPKGFVYQKGTYDTKDSNARLDTSRPRCPRCGVGFDTDGDGDCGYCHVLTDEMLAEFLGDSP